MQSFPFNLVCLIWAQRFDSALAHSQVLLTSYEENLAVAEAKTPPAEFCRCDHVPCYLFRDWCFPKPYFKYWTCVFQGFVWKWGHILVLQEKCLIRTNAELQVSQNKAPLEQPKCPSSAAITQKFMLPVPGRFGFPLETPRLLVIKCSRCK